MLHFEKYHGLGNDVLILDSDKGWTSEILTPELVKKLSHRKTGIGCDQIMVVKKIDNILIDAEIRIFNADGSSAEACGNGTRCVVDYLSRKLNKLEISLLSPKGDILRGIRHGRHDVQVEQGKPKLIQLPEGKETIDLAEYGLIGEVGIPVDMGNPHLVIFLKNRKYLEDFETFGKILEKHPLFPKGANVEFCIFENDDTHSSREVSMFVWERGAGKTLACGSGACAVAFAYFIMNRKITEDMNNVLIVRMEGGALEMSFNFETGIISHRGQAVKVFEGSIDLDRLH